MVSSTTASLPKLRAGCRDNLYSKAIALGYFQIDMHYLETRFLFSRLCFVCAVASYEFTYILYIVRLRRLRPCELSITIA